MLGFKAAPSLILRLSTLDKSPSAERPSAMPRGHPQAIDAPRYFSNNHTPPRRGFLVPENKRPAANGPFVTTRGIKEMVKSTTKSVAYKGRLLALKGAI
jgi:hypothetical protein